MNAGFTPVPRCWVCDGERLSRVHDATFDLHEYATQDPPLAEYTGASIPIVRCAACGFAQPAALPSLPSYFERLYDQRWSDEWVRAEHDGTYKDEVFADVLSGLDARLPPVRRRLLDVGAHAGRFIATARRAGWEAEGLELNPTTRAYAAAVTGVAVHQGNVRTFNADARYDAVTMTDVLEHIPEPRTVLARVREYLAPGGWIAIKVPNGPAQRLKERVRGIVHPAYRPTVADNLVHVNHFTPASLARALAREGFHAITVVTGAPEMPPGDGNGRLLRRLVFTSARTVPGAVHTPLALNLQAYGRRD
jgi:2-polyprenyl-3-methyl-5-hydroxy-6-metoxy-1,4-benzoquinol methylase